MTKDEQIILKALAKEMKDDPLLQELKEELRIDPDKLDELLCNFPGVFAYYGTRYAAAVSSLDTAETVLELLEAETENRLRKSVDFNPKSTQKYIDGLVAMNEDVQTKKAEVIHARFVRDVWKIRLKVCEYSIESICNLGHNHRAQLKNLEPNIPDMPKTRTNGHGATEWRRY